MRKKIVVIVNGYPRVGKDQFVDYCIDSIGEPAKELVTRLRAF